MSWGATWATRMGGGSPAAAAAAVTATPVRQVLAISNALEAAIAQTASGLAPASYRMPLQLQSAAVHRHFQVRLTGARIARQFWGAGKVFLELDVVVRVAYARPGGDAGGGDRKSINIEAGTDGMLISDAIKDPRNWDRENTYIRDVDLRIAALRVVDDRLREVWQHSFRVEAAFPWPA